MLRTIHIKMQYNFNCVNIILVFNIQKLISVFFLIFFYKILKLIAQNFLNITFQLMLQIYVQLLHQMETKIWKTKVCVLGNQNSGKSSIINKFISDTFCTHYSPTIGIDFVSKTLQFENYKIRMQLWDTAGGQRFRSLLLGYLRDSKIIVIVFDGTEKVANLEYWSTLASQSINNLSVPIYLVLNKIDSLSLCDSTPATLWMEAHRRGYEYREVSAKTGQGIQQLFFAIGSRSLVTTSSNFIQHCRNVAKQHNSREMERVQDKETEVLRQMDDEISKEEQQIYQLQQELGSRRKRLVELKKAKDQFLNQKVSTTSPL